METSIRCAIDALRQERERYAFELTKAGDSSWDRLVAHASAGGTFAILVDALLYDLDRLDRAEAEGPKVGDPDSTPDLEGPSCNAMDEKGFLCTLNPDHAGKHVAGDGYQICAVW
jgi:hypothetical protein